MCGSTENTNQNKTARQVEYDPSAEGWSGDARRYELSEPINHPLFGEVTHVIVSGVTDAPPMLGYGDPVSETAAFPLDSESGSWPVVLAKIADRGDAHEEVLQQLGYELVAA